MINDGVLVLVSRKILHKINQYLSSLKTQSTRSKSSLAAAGGLFSLCNITTDLFEHMLWITLTETIAETISRVFFLNLGVL